MRTWNLSTACARFTATHLENTMAVATLAAFRAAELICADCAPRGFERVSASEARGSSYPSRAPSARYLESGGFRHSGDLLGGSAPWLR
eukprot:scaffold1516_cov230-Pinguiococcus_pyrenoidosus.AAC.17